MVMKHTPQPQPETRIIPAGEFKARCLKLMDEVQQGHLTLIVTKRGKPVMQATAPVPDEKSFRPLWGRTPNLKILGDIMAPLDWGDPATKWKKANKAAAKGKK
jgi:antitoxin (DNA-binding transcriptional repressor) of toxin-antitoxin stability system